MKHKDLLEELQHFYRLASVHTIIIGFSQRTAPQVHAGIVEVELWVNDVHYPLKQVSADAEQLVREVGEVLQMPAEMIGGVVDSLKLGETPRYHMSRGREIGDDAEVVNDGTLRKTAIGV